MLKFYSFPVGGLMILVSHSVFTAECWMRMMASLKMEMVKCGHGDCGCLHSALLVHWFWFAC